VLTTTCQTARNSATASIFGQTPAHTRVLRVLGVLGVVV
jgi:hypothetical protein